MPNLYANRARFVENYQEIIESGRLEQYALGELDPAAQAEVEALARRYPDLVAVDGPRQLRQKSLVYGLDAMPVLLDGR